MKFPTWLSPARPAYSRSEISRMGGIARMNALSKEERLALAQKASRAAFAAMTREQLQEYTRRAREVSLRVRAARKAAGNPVRGGTPKLDPLKVADIHRRIAAGEKQDYIAAVHGISAGLVSRIKKGERWA